MEIVRTVAATVIVVYFVGALLATVITLFAWLFLTALRAGPGIIGPIVLSFAVPYLAAVVLGYAAGRR